MGWYFRDPSAFPALFHHTLGEAVRRSPDPVLLNKVSDRGEAQSLMHDFRWFKWALKHPKSIVSPLRESVLIYDLRAEANRTQGNLLLVYVRARPTLLSDLLNLNPTLAAEFSSIVNEKYPSGEGTNRG